MDVKLKTQLLKGSVSIIVALISAAALILSANQGISTIEENSALKEENLQLKESISILEGGTTSLPVASPGPDDDLIAQNLAAILQKKAEYTDSDTQLIENDCVPIYIYMRKRATCIMI